MRKRIYDKKGERGWLKRETAACSARERRWIKERPPFKNGTRHDLFDTVKRNSWESQRNIGVHVRCAYVDVYVTFKHLTA